MAAEVRIVLSEERAGAAIKDVTGDLKHLGDTAESQGGKAKGFFSGMLQTAGGFLAANVFAGIGSQIAGAVTGMIGDAREAAQVMAQTEAVIKSTGGAAGLTAQQVADLASAMSAAAGKSLFGDDDIQKGENLLLTFTNIGQDVFPMATQAMVDMAQAMGTDVSGGAIQLGKALNDPIAGVSALSRVGVTFTDQQKDQIKAMVEAGNVAGAQKLILSELNKEFGGSAQAAAQADGGWAQFSDRLGEAGEQIGGLLLPVLTAVVNFLLDPVMPAIEAVVAGIGPFVASFQTAGESSGILAGALDFLGQVWTQLGPIIDLAVQLINATVVPIFTAIAGFLEAHSAEIQTVLTAAWTIISTTITTTLAIIKGVLTVALDVIKGDWSGAWEAIKGIGQAFWDGIKTIFGAEIDILKSLLSMAWDAIKGAASSAWEGIKSSIRQQFEPVTSALSTVTSNVKTALDTAWGGIQSAASSAWSGISTAAGTSFSAISGAVGGVVSSLKTTLDGWWTTISGAASSAWNGIAGAVSSAFAGVVSGIRGVINGIIDAVNDAISAFNDLPGPDIGLIPHVQSGTSFFRGGMAIVGEAGPELVFLPRGSQVMNASDTRTTLSGGGATVRLSVDDRGLGWLKNLIRVEIADAQGRTGNLAFSRMRTGG